MSNQVSPLLAAVIAVASLEEDDRQCILCGQCQYWQWGASPGERSKKQETEGWGYCELAYLNKFKVNHGFFYVDGQECEGLDTHRAFGCVSGKVKGAKRR